MWYHVSLHRSCSVYMTGQCRAVVSALFRQLSGHCIGHPLKAMVPKLLGCCHVDTHAAAQGDTVLPSSSRWSHSPGTAIHNYIMKCLFVFCTVESAIFVSITKKNSDTVLLIATTTLPRGLYGYPATFREFLGNLKK